MKNILKIFIALTVIVLVCGCSGNTGEVETVYEHFNESTGKLEAGNAEQVNEFDDGFIPVERIYNDFQANEIRANKEWRNKEVKIKGIIDDIKDFEENTDKKVITVKSKDEVFVDVDCYFEKDSIDENTLMSLSAGNEIKVSGKVVCYGSDYDLDNCEIVND